MLSTNGHQQLHYWLQQLFNVKDVISEVNAKQTGRLTWCLYNFQQLLQIIHSNLYEEDEEIIIVKDITPHNSLELVQQS